MLPRFSGVVATSAFYDAIECKGEFLTLFYRAGPALSLQCLAVSTSRCIRVSFPSVIDAPTINISDPPVVFGEISFPLPSFPVVTDVSPISAIESDPSDTVAFLSSISCVFADPSRFVV